MASYQSPLWAGLIFFLAMAGITAILVVSRVWLPFQRFQQIRGDLAAGQVRLGDGWLTFGKDGFEPQIAGAACTCRWEPPGLSRPPITAFASCRSQAVVLSASALGPLSEPQARQLLNEITAAGFGYQPEALLENRQGRMRLYEARPLLNNLLLGFGLMAILGPWFGYWSLVGLVLEPGRISLNANILDVCLAVVGVVGGAYLAAGPLVDLLFGRLMIIEGPVDLDVNIRQTDIARPGRRRYGRTFTLFYWVVDGKRFRVALQAAAALVKNLPYRLNVTPRKVLVAAEPLALPKPAQPAAAPETVRVAPRQAGAG